MRSTILVTGGAGFIGSCLVRQLLQHDANVRVVTLDKLTYAGQLDALADAANDPRHVFIRGDVADAALAAGLLQEFDPQAIVHLAAESHVDRSIDGPAPFVQSNVVGTFTLLEAARRHWGALPEDRKSAFRFLHVSTDEVYGSLGPQGAFHEATPYDPRSPYSASKAAADHFVRAYHHTYGLPTIVTHSSNNFGPCQFPEKLIPLIISKAVAGQPLPVYGDGLHVRDWLYVEDHCTALRLALQRGRPGESYNVGGGGERTNLDMVRTICRLVDAQRPELPHRPTAGLITHVADRPGHDRRYAIDSSKIRRELGWAPRHGLDESLERTVRWYLEHPQWLARIAAGPYRGQRLGLRAA